MTQLTTIELLEQAVGRTFAPGAETDEANYLIDKVSEYVISYTGASFAEVTQTERLKADYYGIIDLQPPVSDVATVVRWRTGGEHQSWQWDGLSRVYGLLPVEVVDVTYTSGFATVPDDIAMVTTEGAKRLLESPSGEATGPRTRYRVGDVEESYRAVDIETLAGLFNDLEKLILNSYRVTETTWRVGFSLADNISNIPESDTALSE